MAKFEFMLQEQFVPLGANWDTRWADIAKSYNTMLERLCGYILVLKGEKTRKFFHCRLHMRQAPMA